MLGIQRNQSRNNIHVFVENHHLLGCLNELHREQPEGCQPWNSRRQAARRRIVNRTIVVALQHLLGGPGLIGRAPGRARPSHYKRRRRVLPPFHPTPSPAFASSQDPRIVLAGCHTPVRSGLPSDARGTSAPIKVIAPRAKNQKLECSHIPSDCGASTADRRLTVSGARGRAEVQLLAVLKSNLPPMRPLGAVARQPSEHRHLITRFQRPRRASIRYG